MQLSKLKISKLEEVVMAPRKPMSSPMAIAMEEHDIKVLTQMITDEESVNSINGSTGKCLIT